MQQKITYFFKKFWSRILFITLGLGSLIWFLVRVIPKPSRVMYPCIKATAPLASTFVTYLIGLTSFTFLFRKARERFLQSKWLLASIFTVLGISAGVVVILSNTNATWAMDLQGPQTGNEPVGAGKGIFPGRVVWIHNTDATNESCTNGPGDYWSSDDNTDQDVVAAMLSEALQDLTGADNDADAWDAIFRNYNQTHGRGDVGYTEGEKIVIKINLNGLGNSWTSSPPKNINTSPQLCYALLDQLVNTAGVAQSDIAMGDANVSMGDVTFNKLNPDFPDVTFWGNGAGLTSVSPTSEDVLFASDGSYSDPLPTVYIAATYMINVPVFKKHHRAGISISSKNHFGSIAPFTGGAWHLHPSLPVPDANGGEDIDDLPTLQYGVYRCFVDIMGHKDLGGKTILHLVDGLWGSVNWGHPPVKYRMTPFNGDWPNSLFVSIDPVAVQSVCYDFLYHEFDPDHPTEGIDVLGDDKGPFSRFPAADDFLHQAADAGNWPSNVDYDPEDDGSILGSLGTHEHWNNATDKQYSRNLGTGNGIELVGTYAAPVGLEKMEFKGDGIELYPNYPNPFSESTTISFRLASPSVVELVIFNASGQIVDRVNYFERMVGEYTHTWNSAEMPAGQYICSLRVYNQRGHFELSNKMLVVH